MIKKIDSSGNPSFKGWHGLTKKKYRDRDGLFLLEGEVLIKEALKEGASVKELIFREDIEDMESILERLFGEEGKEYVASGNRGAEGKELRAFLLRGELFDELSQTENGRDIIAVIEKPANPKKSLGERLKDKKYISSILVLDRIQDPGNMGTIIRTADAFGMAGIAVVKGSADIFSPKTVRSAAGSILRVPILTVQDEDELFSLAADLGLKVIATGLKDSEDVRESDLREGLAIVIGNEGRGVSETILERAERRIKIPMEGRIDSLNAAIATAIIVYECKRQKSIERG